MARKRPKHYTKYLVYLKSDAWKKKRLEALAYYGESCGKCGTAEKQLHVHHKTYKRLFDEPLEDLQVLCDTCHRRVHSKPERRSRPRVKAKKEEKKVVVVVAEVKKNGFLKQYRKQRRRILR
jgi:5-methylcytosine-specific restriction endonuclease McrA